MTHPGPHPSGEMLTLWALGDCDALDLEALDCDPFQRDAIAAHCQECARCRREAEAARRAIALVRLDGDVVPTDAQLAAARLAARSALRPLRRLPAVAWGAGAAAAALLGLAIVGLAKRGEVATPETAKSTPGARETSRGRTVPVQPGPTALVPEPEDGAGSVPEAATPESSPRAPDRPALADRARAVPAPDDAPPPLRPNPFETPTGPVVEKDDADDPAPAPQSPTPSATARVETPSRPAPPSGPVAPPDAGDAGTTAPTAPTSPETPRPASTGPTTPPAMYLSALVGIGSATAHWPTGAQELERGDGIPHGVDVVLTPRVGAPLVLVLPDGGLVSVTAKSATVRVDAAAEPAGGADVHPRPGGLVVRGKADGRPGGDALGVTPEDARRIYVAVPPGLEGARRVALGRLALDVRPGHEVLVAYTGKGELAALLSLSGEQPLRYEVDGQPRECPAGHAVDLTAPGADARPGAEAMAGGEAAPFRRLHAAESLRVVLEAAKASPVSSRLSDTLSHLRPDTLRRTAPSIARLIAVLKERDASSADTLCIARYLRAADKAEVDVLFIVGKALWATREGLSGGKLDWHLEKALELAKRERADKGEARKGK